MWPPWLAFHSKPSPGYQRLAQMSEVDEVPGGEAGTGDLIDADGPFSAAEVALDQDDWEVSPVLISPMTSVRPRTRARARVLGRYPSRSPGI